MARKTVSVLRRTILAAVLLGVMALALGVLGLPQSEAASSGNCTYYSSGSYTTVVGQFGKDCCNNPVAWGVKTKWAICGGCFVCTPPPR